MLRAGGPRDVHVHPELSVRSVVPPRPSPRLDLDAVPSDAYGAIVSTDALEHVPFHSTRYRFLEEFFRVLECDGRVALHFGFGPGPGEPSKKWSYANGDHSVEKPKKAIKCDMCAGIEGGPSCVRACPTGAAIRVAPDEFLTVARLEQEEA